MLTMRNSADDVQMTYVPADDMQMMYMPADDMWMTYLPADDVRMMFRMTYVIRQPKSPTKSRSRVICTSSVHRPLVVHMSSARHPLRDFNPKIFPVKEQRTALLKMKTLSRKMEACLPHPNLTLPMCTK